MILEHKNEKDHYQVFDPQNLFWKESITLNTTEYTKVEKSEVEQ